MHCPAELQATLDRHHDNLATFQRRAIIAAIAQTVMHEFNNLMTPVLARAEHSLMLDDRASLRKSAETTLEHGRQALDVCTRLLEFVDGGDVAEEPCSVRESVTHACSLLVRPFSKDGIEFHADISPASLTVRAKRPLFEQLLVNLLLDAQTTQRRRSGAISVSARSNASMVEIVVCDQRGEEHMPAVDCLLNPFLSKPLGELAYDLQNHGMAWNVCRLVTQLHGGTIQAAHNEPMGLRVEIRWPIG